MPGLTLEEKKFRKENPIKILTGEKRKNHRTRRTWDQLYDALVKYKEKHGDCDVPQRDREDPGLGKWVGKQRRDRDQLSEEQRNRLRNINFDFSTGRERIEREWNEKLARLKKFQFEFGHCRVPQTSVKEELAPWASELGVWVCSQREKYKLNKLEPDRQQKLEAIGFEWTLCESKASYDRKRDDEKWFEKYNRLVDFKEENGHTMVPRFYDKDHSLGGWVGKQRDLYTQNRIKEDRKELLDEIGFVWKIDKADPKASLSQREWDDSFNRVAEFKKTHGHVDVPMRFTKWNLGVWLCRQKVEGRKGTLDPRRAQRLLDLGVTWGRGFDERWEECFGLLKKFRTRHGHCCPTINQSVKLNGFVQNQRKLQERGVLVAERKRKLDEIGFLWKGEHRVKGPAPKKRRLKARPNLDDSEDEEASFHSDEETVSLQLTDSSNSKADDAEEPSDNRLENARDALPCASAANDQGDKKKHTSSIEGNAARKPYAAGSRVRDYFKGYGWLTGKILDSSNGRYKILYRDGNIKTFSWSDPKVEQIVEYALSNTESPLDLPHYASMTKVRKHFDGYGWFNGSIDSNDGSYRITYEDDDCEELSIGDPEVDVIVAAAAELSKDEPMPTIISTAVAQKPETSAEDVSSSEEEFEWDG